MPIVRITLPAEKRALREKMRALGLGHREIAAEFARRYRLRPRAAWREAHGWSLREAAAQINAYTGTVGLDPGGISSMTAPHLCEHENWPGPGPQPSGRRPSPYLLALLACVYGCTTGDLIDLADREQLPPAELLILDTYSQELPNLRNENRPPQLPHPLAPRGSDADTAAMLAVAAVFAVALGAILRRSAAAITIAVVTVVLPFLLAALNVLPAGAGDWLLRVTPAAGLAVEQSIPRYAQVTTVTSPIQGYYPLSPCAGFAVLCLWAAAALALALVMLRRRDA